jgi:hypothetical protein
MSSWHRRKRGVCQLNAAPRRCTGEINIRKGQLSSRSPWQARVGIGPLPLRPTPPAITPGAEAHRDFAPPISS